MIYRATGCVTYSFDEYVEASSEEEVEDKMEFRAEHGLLANIEVNDFFLDNVEEIVIEEE